MDTSCLCKYFSEPQYHARDNPHSIENKWHCPEHGAQENYFLIHEQKQADCRLCQGAERLKFQVGDKVVKVKGYKFPGTVVAAFYTTGNEARYVVEMEEYGLLHSFNGEQLDAEVVGEKMPREAIGNPSHPYWQRLKEELDTLRELVAHTPQQSEKRLTAHEADMLPKSECCEKCKGFLHSKPDEPNSVINEMYNACPCHKREEREIEAEEAAERGRKGEVFARPAKEEKCEVCKDFWDKPGDLVCSACER